MSLNLAMLVLMGGQNKRMNGHHKAFLSLNHTTFLDTILKTLEGSYPIYLSVNDHSQFKDLPYPLIEDAFGPIGPIGAIASAFQILQEDYLFVTACDMPFITKEYINFLCEQIAFLPPHKKAIVLRDEEGFFYPLGAIYHKSILPQLLDMIANKNYRLQYLLRHNEGMIIPLSDTPFSKKVLRNINTPEDYKKVSFSS